MKETAVDTRLTWLLMSLSKLYIDRAQCTKAQLGLESCRQAQSTVSLHLASLC